MTTMMVNPFSTQDALIAKVITMVTLFTLSMIVGLIPMAISLKFDWFTKAADGDLRTKNKLVMGLLAFGGGVLFSTTFMHLLHEVDENIAILQEDGDLADLPVYLGGLIMSMGFFMMYLIEELVHMYIDSRNKKSSNLSRTFSIRKPSSDSQSMKDELREMENARASRLSHGHSHTQQLDIDSEEDSMMSALRGLLIVLALSIHELFEGLAVGLESSVANVWYMFGAVSAHKYIIAFCIGVELLAAGTKRWLSIVYIFTFSFVSAFGIGIGILLVGGAGAAEAGIYSVVLQGLACGTLVYVVFFEVWKRDGSGIRQFLFGFAGFAIMTMVNVIVEVTLES
ncbi:zinc transporter ZIP1-like [Ostrinia nubilalis]|uniref:zinc transporter ZIP1-like n=1 Tax=Ostrinia nubilalis TaxID=29057 RepID=UPI0030825F9D